MPRQLRLLALLCLGCGSVQPPTASTPAVTAAEQVARGPSEVLAPEARYADLVRAASELEGAQRPASSCLLEQTPHDYRLRSELSSAVRPLPQPSEDLDETLKGVAHVELLTAWGRHGDGNGKLALAGFTSGAPAHDAFALILTDRGIALRSPSGSSAAPLDGLDASHALTALAALDPQRSAAIFVAAEAGFPLHGLARVLGALTTAQRSVVLASNLAPNTALPLPASATAKVARCPDGLSATDAAEGSLPKEELMTGISPLRDHAADCLGRGDARGAAGGRLKVAFRIAENGRVQEACISSDEVTDIGVAACVVDLASQLTFRSPQPVGVIDLELPIALHANPLPALRPLCGPAGT